MDEVNVTRQQQGRIILVFQHFYIILNFKYYLKFLFYNNKLNISSVNPQITFETGI